MMFVFTRPQYLILLLVIPVLIFIHIISVSSAKRRSVKFANFDAITRINGVEIFSKNLTVLYLNIFMVVLIILSLSGMSISREVDASGVSFVIAIDSSRSMSANDILPDRFKAAKDAAKHFVDNSPSKTKVAILSFSGTAFIEQELTEDKPLLRSVIDSMEIKLVGGTDILEVIATSSNILRNEETKAIILISDGQANINNLKEIVDYSSKNNVIVHTLGVGTEEGGEDELGGTFKISESNLETISSNTGGHYYHVKEIDDFYYSLDEISQVTRKNVVTDLSFYLTIAALILFVVNFILINTRYRSFP